MDNEQRRNLILELLRSKDEQLVQFLTMAGEQYPGMKLETPSAVYLGQGNWIARGAVDTRISHHVYVVRGDLARTDPCVLRGIVAPKSKLWGMIYIQDNAIPPGYNPMEALKEHEADTILFLGELRRQYPSMQLFSGSMCRLDDVWVAKGVSNQGFHLIAADFDFTCIMRTTLTEPYKAWFGTYVQLDELPHINALRNFRGSWLP